MKAVNLLPERDRPRSASGGRKGSSYVLLGVLGAVLLGALFYVLTLNSINSSRDQVATFTQQAQRDTALADSLGAYGDFAKIKQQRVASVMQAAQQRIDWELLMRELGRVLPDGVWVTKVSASASGAPGASTPAPAAAAAASSPALQVSGCAPSQDQVAVSLVRFKQLRGAATVQLTQSGRPDTSSGGAASSSSSSGSTGCGTTNGKPNYSFDATVTFTPAQAQLTAPSSLGGGS